MTEDAPISAELNDELHAAPTDASALHLRSAKAADLPEVQAWISAAAAAGRVLPMSAQTLAQRLRDLIVVENEGVLVGLASSAPLSAERGEIGLLLGHGPVVEQVLLDAVLDSLRGLGMVEAVAFTNSPAPLLAAGLRSIARAEVPEKSLGACLRCAAAPRCRRKALAISLV